MSLAFDSRLSELLQLSLYSFLCPALDYVLLKPKTGMRIRHKGLSDSPFDFRTRPCSFNVLQPSLQAARIMLTDTDN